MNRALAAAAVLGLSACGPREPRALPKTRMLPEVSVMEWKGQHGGAETASASIIESQARWEDLWRGLGQAAPAVDFDHFFAVAILLGDRPTGGFGVRFLEPREDPSAGALTVRWLEIKPDGMVIQAFTRPWGIRVYPRTTLRVLTKQEPS